MSDSPELRVKRHTQQRTQIQSESAWFSHPCLSQLLTHYDKIISILEKGLNVDTIYLDFAKAFFNGFILPHQQNAKCHGQQFPLWACTSDIGGSPRLCHDPEHLERGVESIVSYIEFQKPLKYLNLLSDFSWYVSGGIWGHVPAKKFHPGVILGSY